MEMTDCDGNVRLAISVPPEMTDLTSDCKPICICEF